MDDHELRRTVADWLGLPTGETTLQVHDALWQRLGERDAWKQSAEVAAAASASHCRLAMEMQRQRDAANAERAAWVNLFGCIAKNLKCLPSMFVDGDEHVAAKAASVMAERDAARTEAEKLRAVDTAARRFIAAFGITTDAVPALEALREALAGAMQSYRLALGFVAGGLKEAETETFMGVPVLDLSTDELRAALVSMAAYVRRLEGRDESTLG